MDTDVGNFRIQAQFGVALLFDFDVVDGIDVLAGGYFRNRKGSEIARDFIVFRTDDQERALFEGDFIRFEIMIGKMGLHDGSDVGLCFFHGPSTSPSKSSNSSR